MLISAIGFPATHVKPWSTLMSTASDMRDLFGVLLRYRTGSCRVGDCSTWSLWMVARRRSCGGILAEFLSIQLFAGRRSCDGILAEFLSIYCLLGGVVTASLWNFYQFTVCWEELWRHPCGISINSLFAGRSCGGVLAEFLSIYCLLGGVVAASLRNFYQFTVCWEELWRRPCGISINLLFAGRSCGGVLAEFLSIAFSLGEGIVAASLRNFYHLPFR